MPQPSVYNRQNSFTGLAAQNPDTPYTGVQLDAEFNAVKVTLDELLENLALIQRDDGELANNSVGAEQIEASMLTGLDPASPWQTATAYETTDTVTESNKLYHCIVAHTSGTFATDLAASKWEELVDFTSFAISPGSITATELASDSVITAKILDDAVTYAKIQNVSDTDKVLGRSTAGPGSVEEIACTAVGRAILAAANAGEQRTALELGDLAVEDELATTDLTDIGGSAPTDGQVLTWVDANSRYEPATPSGGGGGGAPTDVDYLVRTAAGALTAERVVTDTSTVSWDWATAGQAKASVVDASISAAKLASNAVTTAKVADGAITAAKLDGGVSIGELTGAMKAWAGIDLPSGYLWCDGSAVSRATYAALFAVLSKTVTGNRTSGSTSITGVASDLRNKGLVGAKIEGTGIPAGATITALTATTITLSASATSGAGTSTSLTIIPWGAGNGSTTFNVPDKRGRVGAGRDDMGDAGASAAGRLTSATVTGTVLGSVGGAQTHTLTVAELAAHSHTATTSASTTTTGAHSHSGTTSGTSGASHDHTYQGRVGTTDAGGGGAVGGLWYGSEAKTSSNAAIPHTHDVVIGTSGGHSHTISASTTVNSAGSGDAHNNVQPTIVENWIIKT